MISIDDVVKLDIRVGTIKSVEKVPDTDKLLVLSLDVGESSDRQIVSGIAEHYEDINTLVGRQVPVVVNLETKTIRGVESYGMILYVVGDKLLTTLEPGKKNIIPGTKIK